MTSYKFENVDKIRSRTMKSIKSKNTNGEMLLRKELFRSGLRYRLHSRDLPGKPDIVFVRKKIAIFCDGEFWHGKDWEIKRKRIKNNREYWVKKIENNIKRDKENTRKLINMGWVVLRYWEKEIKNESGEVVNDIITHLNERKS